MSIFAGGCLRGGDEQEAGDTARTLQDAFTIVDTIRIEDVPGDTVAEIGAVETGPNGELLLADRYLPRIRLYTNRGRYLAGQGSAGDAPFEYRRVHDVAFDPLGRVVVHSQGVGRYTVLSSDLQPDTIVAYPRGVLAGTGVEAFRDGLVHTTVMEDGVRRHVRTDATGRIEWAVEAGPSRISEVPYWASVARYFVDTAGDTLINGNSLLYPIELRDPAGSLIGTLSSPPPSYREVPEVEAGAFAITDPSAGYPPALLEWLESFTVIAGIHVVRDRWLAVSHGTIATDRPPQQGFEAIEYALDLYELTTGEKILEDIDLPENARILAGGSYLHVLTAAPPEPWTILRLELRPELQAGS